MNTYPARNAFTLHRMACPRCRLAHAPHGFCDAGQTLLAAAQDEWSRPQQEILRQGTMVLWLGLAVIAVSLLLLMTACGQVGAPVLAAAGAVVPQGELVWVLAQTERAVQIGSSAETGPGEVADALGWPRLTLPAQVCVAFEGAPGITKKRTARLLDRSACQGATK